ncbi:CRP-like cAMP-binding protein [Rhizobium pisi]
MSSPRQHLLKNKLLNILPEQNFVPLAPHLELVALQRGSIIAKRGENFEHVYFLESGIASLVATTPAGNQAEAGVFGFEGYVPTTAIAGVDSSTHDISMQWDGEAYRMSYENFRVSMEGSKIRQGEQAASYYQAGTWSLPAKSPFLRLRQAPRQRAPPSVRFRTRAHNSPFG